MNKKKMCGIIMVLILSLLFVGSVSANNIENNSDSSNINSFSSDLAISNNLSLNDSSIDNSIYLSDNNYVSDNNYDGKSNINDTNVVDDSFSYVMDENNFNKFNAFNLVEDNVSSLNSDLDGILVYSLNLDDVSSVVDYPVNSIFVDCTSGLDTNGGTSWDDAVNSINKALSLASNGYTIYLANGTYTGDLNVNQVISFNNLAICANYTGGAVIDGESKNKIFTFNSAGNFVLNGINLTHGSNTTNGKLISVTVNRVNLTVLNCSFTNTGTVTDSGGAMCFNGIQYSNLTIKNSLFDTLSARNGAVIFFIANSAGNPKIDIFNSTFTNSKSQIASTGAIAIGSNVNVSINNCTFVNNTGASTGGCISSQSDLNVSNCIFTNNSAFSGGCIGTYKPNIPVLNVSNCTFTHNIATGTQSGKGGAIFWNGTINLNNSVFIDNSAVGYAGAILAGDDPTNSTISNCVFDKNWAVGDNKPGLNLPGAGTLYVFGKCLIINSSFSNSYVTLNNGGAIYIRNGNNLTVIDCNFTNNSANKSNFVNGYGYQGYGGAIIADPGAVLNIYSSNFINNSADKGGAISVKSDSSDMSQVNIYDSYFENNFALGNGTDISGAGGAIYNGGDVIVLNSTFFNNTGYNGGAVYAGELSHINMSNSDFINNSANGTGGSIFGGSGSESFINNSNLINNSAILNGGAIFSSPNGLIQLNSSIFTNNSANKGGAIYGDTGSDFSDWNSEFINNNAFDAGAVYVDAHVILNGTIFNNNSARNNGGAIYCGKSGNSTIDNAQFWNNFAKIDGGAIYSVGDLNVHGSILEGNNAIGGHGGTIFILNGNSIIDSSNFYNSSAAYGGLIYNENGTLYMHIQNTVGNDATIAGGFLYNKNGTVTILISNIINNTAGSYGGFAVNENGNLTVYNTTIMGNTAGIDGGFLYSNGSNAFNNFSQSIIVDNNVSNGKGTDIFLSGTNLTNVDFNANWWGVNYPDNNKYYWTNWTNRISVENPIEGSIVSIDTWITLNNSLLITNPNTVTLTSNMYLTNDQGDNLGIFDRNANGTFNISDFNDTIDYIKDTVVDGVVSDNFNSVPNIDLIGYSQVDYQIVNDTVYASVINSSNIVVDLGVPSNITGTLYFNNGSAISNTNVSFNLIGDNGDVIPFVLVTDANGNFVLEDLTLRSGLYNLTYAGNEKIWNSTLAGVIFVRYNTTVILDNVSGYSGEIVNITVSVNDQYDHPVANGTVSTVINGTVYTATVSNGKATFTDVVLPIAGDFVYNVSYFDDKDYYMNNSAIANIHVVKLNTTIVVSNVTGKPGENKTVSISVNNEFGNPITGGNVVVTLPNGTDVTVAVVNGSANITMILPSCTGNYTLNAVYGGSDMYIGNSTNGNVSVGLWNITVGVPDINGYPGEKLNVIVNVTDELDRPVLNGTVSTIVNGTVYTATVVNGVATFVDVVLPNMGNFTYNVSYIGNDYYANGSSVADIIVTKLNTTVIVPDIVGKPGEDKIVSIRVTDELGNSVTEGNVVVILPNGTSVTVAVVNGFVNITMVLPSGAGNYTLNATYGGSDKYGGNSTEGNVTVGLWDTIVSVPDISGYPGEKLNVIVNVTDELDRPVLNGTVSTVVNGTVYTATVVNGVATFVDVVLPNAGNFTYNVSFTGNDYYANGSSVADIIVTKLNTTIVVSNVTGKPGENKSVSIRVTDELGNPITGGNVVVILPNGTSVTVAVVNGFVNITMVLPSGAGNYTLNATYGGSDKYGGNSTEGNVTVGLWNITVGVPDISGYPGEKLNVSVSVTDELGRPVLDGTVSTVVNGSTYTATVVNGVATFVDVVLPNAGDYTYNVSYSGNDYYGGSSAVGDIIVTKLNVTVDVPVVTGNPGENVSVLINVTDELGRPVVGGNVTVTLPNGTNITVAVVNGSANVTVPLPNSTGNYTWNVTYSGSDEYDGNSTDFNMSIGLWNTTVVVDDISGYPGEKVNITVNVTDDLGRPVMNGTVSTVVNGTTYTATVLNGSATFIDVVLPNMGNYTYNVGYTGNDYYVNSSSVADIIVTKLNTTVSVENITGNPGENKTVSISVTDELGNPVTEGNVIVTLHNGTNITVAVVNGSANVSVILSATGGDFTLNATYNGSDKYNVSNGTGFIGVPLFTTNVVLDNVSGHPGDKVNITVNITNHLGHTVTNGTVSTVVNGSTYTATVVNGSATFVDVVLPNMGNYTYYVTYNNTEYYANSSAVADINVTKVGVVVTVPVVTGNPGENVSVLINVTDDFGNPVVGGNVTVTLPNGTNITVAVVNGSANVTVPLPNSTGNYTWNVTYSGSDEYDGNSTSFNMTVGLWNTTVVVDDISGYPGEKVNITVNVTDELGRPVMNGTVSTVVNGTNYTATVLNGTAIFTDVVLPGINSTFDVNYEGNNYYANGSAVADINVTKVGVVVTVPVVTGNPGENVSVLINVTDDFGNPVTGGNVTVTLPNGTNISVPVVNGSANVTVPLPNSTGNYTWNVTYSGSDEYDGNSTSFNMSIGLWNTTVVVDDISGYPGEKVNITVNVTDELGRPVMNGTVSTVVNGTNYTATVLNGTAIFTDVVLPGINSTFDVNYEGNGYYANGSAVADINVTKVGVVVTVPVVTGNPGENVSVLINVTDDFGNPVTGGNVTVTLPNGTIISVPVVNGSANITMILPNTAGNYTWNITYGGSGEYDSVISNFTVTVNGTNPKPHPQPSPKPHPNKHIPNRFVDIRDYGGVANDLSLSEENLTSVNHGANGISMEKTGNPILVLLLALLVLPFLRKRDN